MAAAAITFALAFAGFAHQIQRLATAAAFSFILNINFLASLPLPIAVTFYHGADNFTLIAMNGHFARIIDDCRT